MTDISATEVSRGLASVLDAVEHHGEHFTVVRHGKPIARIEPIHRGEGLEIKELLNRTPLDGQWSVQLAAVRSLLEVDER